LEKTVIAVGDSSKLEIIFNTKTYKSKVTKRPKIQTNEGPPDKRVSITATITPRPDSTYPIRIKPYKLDMSQLSDKVIDKAEFTISNISEEKLDVEMITFSKELFDVELPESIGPGKTIKAVVKLKKDATDKSFEKSFTIELSDQYKSRFTVPVKRIVRNSTGKQASTRKLDIGK